MCSPLALLHLQAQGKGETFRSCQAGRLPAAGWERAAGRATQGDARLVFQLPLSSPVTESASRRAREQQLFQRPPRSRLRVRGTVRPASPPARRWQEGRAPWLPAMSLASGPGPGWLLFSLGMGLVSGSKCPSKCQCLVQEVTCTGMQLTEYPPDIPLNTRRLYLDDNDITFLPAMDLGLLSDLVYLDCRSNLIGEVMDYTFVGVFKLIYLDLSSNNLTSISPYGFSMLGHLVHLNISNNPRLSSLNRYTFANTSSLRYLDLRNTGLRTLDHAAFQGLLTLHTLYLSGNPWRCNCSFLDFTIYLIVAHLNHPGEHGAGAGGRGGKWGGALGSGKGNVQRWAGLRGIGGADGEHPCPAGPGPGLSARGPSSRPRLSTRPLAAPGKVTASRSLSVLIHKMGTIISPTIQLCQHKMIRVDVTRYCNYEGRATRDIVFHWETF